MLRTGSSKYLQLPAHDSSDIGKPSPLALLAATCQRIGAGSPSSSQSPRHRPRTPSPVLRSEQPTIRPTPSIVSAPTRSPVMPVSPVARETTSDHPKACKSPAAAYQYPLTPPSSPQQLESKVPSSRMSSVPVPVSSPVERLSYAAEHPCHLPLQPVLHMPSLHYSPYTMVVPAPSSIISPYTTSCVNQCCCTPHLPAVHPMLSLPAGASFAAGARLQPTAPLSPPLSFGTYLHHDVEARLSSAGKMKSHHAMISSGHLYRPYDFTKHPSRRQAEEEFIDVVSV
ncbi:transcription factor Sp5 [Strongylocentrotus purpuratus]|uniref:Uncharacterized protein n=1 Tax=Strongylocentrotus purpuratus TaxID=7668 RepID=A0A7M7RHY7_STRPU|nr:transcription factor Sp5 [Strongylocentrotus purpuratus]